MPRKSDALVAGKGGVLHDGQYVPPGEPIPGDWPAELRDGLEAGGGAVRGKVK